MKTFLCSIKNRYFLWVFIFCKAIGFGETLPKFSFSVTAFYIPVIKPRKLCSNRNFYTMNWLLPFWKICTFFLKYSFFPYCLFLFLFFLLISVRPSICSFLWTSQSVLSKDRVSYCAVLKQNWTQSQMCVQWLLGDLYHRGSKNWKELLCFIKIHCIFHFYMCVPV